MKMFVKTWQNFKAQPDVWFFYGFLLTFTLSIRKVLFFYPLAGQFNEYAGIYLYLSDILLILTLLAWGYITLYNNKHYLSNTIPPLLSLLNNVPRLPRRMFHVEHSYWGGTFLIAPLLLVIWSLLSLIWAENKFLALFRSAKLLEFYLLYLYLILKIVPRLSRRLFHVEQLDWDGTIFRNSIRIIIGLGVFQSAIAIWQFLIQQSIGLTWLRESLIGPDILGVAKVILDGHKIVRVYGLFPHPNILGGFLLISIILTWSAAKMFRMEQSKATNVSRGTISKTSIFLIVQILALILTFSKSAWLGLFLASAYILYSNVPPGTLLINQVRQLFYVEQFGRKLLLATGIILMLLVIAKPDTNSLLFKSLNERLFYLNVSRGTILAHPVVGVGAGQSVLEMNKYAPRLSADSADGTNIESWQYQPVHNVFLLIWSELGIFGFGLFSWWIWKLFHVKQKITRAEIKCSTWNNDQCEVYAPIMSTDVSRGTNENSHREAWISHAKTLRSLEGILLGLIFIMLFDHYLWDIQQGQILFWLVAGLLVGAAHISSIDKS